MGLGNYTRANAEICLLATKGKGCKVIDKTIPQICDSPLTKHSKKPDVLRSRIVRLFGDLPRMELFARTKIHGWDVWGNDEKLKSVTLETFG
jgi:site-specific DNA-methyltransferase (adenine-specific)